MQIKKLVTASSILIAVIALGLILTLKNQVPTPSDWPQSVKVYRNSLTGLTSVVDGETGEAIFLHLPSPYYLPTHLERTNNTQWVVTFEKINQHDGQ